ncbi:MAG: DNA helicase II [Pseudomonadota bacterium]
MDVTSILADLNDAQRQAVTSEHQELLVLAGAGSGKTRVLVHRMAWLMELSGANYAQILAVTFTNKASREMRERVLSLQGNRDDGARMQPGHSSWIGTFHSLCHRFLRQHHTLTGLNADFQILDGEDQLRLLKRLHKELGIEETELAPALSRWFISRQKDQGLRPHESREKDSDVQPRLIEVYQRYEEICRKSNVIDFGEILLRTCELLEQNPDLLKYYQNRFEHILVDEFQDTNDVQHRWIKLLHHPKHTLTLVGDDDQSIYGWRGARVEHIRQFNRDFPEGEIIRLEQNYRSTQVILEAANHIIGHNQDRLGKNLWTAGAKGEPIQVYGGFNEVDEARFVASHIERLQQENINYDEIAILYRSNAQSRVLEDALIQKNVPYKIYGGVRFFERAEIKSALAYLRLICSRDDDAALDRIINFPTRGIGDKTLDLIRQIMRDRGISMWKACCILIESKELAGRSHSSLNQFFNLLDNLEEECKGKSLDRQIEITLQRSGLLTAYQSERGEKAQTRIENLQELVSAGKAHEQEFYSDVTNETDHAFEALRNFLDDVGLEFSENEKDSRTTVQLMTMHAAKGLEFAVVYLTGMENGLFPSAASIQDPIKMEEERRLCYVGITRARQKLVMTYAEQRRIYGEYRMHTRSKFLNELPDGYIEEIRLNGTLRRPVSWNSQSSISFERPNYHDSDLEINQDPESSTPEFRVGQTVHHEIFGEGMIIAKEGRGERARLQIRFKRVGDKWLLAGVAPLKASPVFSN